MYTTTEDIEEWFKRGLKENKKFMIVWCDTFNYEYYPEFYSTKEGAIKAKNKPENMQRYIESYDLIQDMDIQINKFRNDVL